MNIVKRDTAMIKGTLLGVIEEIEAQLAIVKKEEPYSPESAIRNDEAQKTLQRVLDKLLEWYEA